MLVTATAKGYYGGKVREIGEVFGLAAKADLSKTWMEPVKGEKPSRPAPAKGGADTEVIPPADPAKASDPITGDEI